MNQLFELMDKILAVEGNTVELEVPEENFNLLMLHVLQDKAKAANKRIVFRAVGPRGKKLLSSLSEEGERSLPAPSEKVQEKVVKTSHPHKLLRRVLLALFIIFAVVLLLVGAAYVALYYLPKAEVILTLNPIPLVKEIPVVADTSVDKVDATRGTIPGTSQVVEESGTKSTPATGTATIGNKATGTITFLNCDTSNTISFPAGTLIHLESNVSLAYSLDGAVSNIPKRVGGTCGSKTGDVTATKIGSSYNQDEGAAFNFSGYSNTLYDASVNSGQLVSGGSSQQVTIVAAADQSKLLNDLESALVTKAKDQITSGSGTDDVVLDKAVKSEVMAKTYSHAVGEQADEVSLTMTVKLSTISYKGTDIQNLVSQSLSSLIPSGFALFPSETDISPLSPKLGSGKLNFQAKISAQVVPKIDEQKIKEDLAGRNSDSATAYLSSLGDVSAYELKLWPNLPVSLQRVPRDTGRITVTLITETVSPQSK